MAELTQQEKLQPALLDRLTDLEPSNPEESRDKRIVSLRDLRRAVLRDLRWLIDTTNYESGCDLDGRDEVARSVLNYGIAELTGRSKAGLDGQELAQLIKKSIANYEPRIIKDTLDVKIQMDDEQMNQRAITFFIEGELWAQPVPMRVYLKTELDLEKGTVSIDDLS